MKLLGQDAFIEPRPLRSLIRHALDMLHLDRLTVLDLGCGNGHDVVPLLRIGAIVKAVDCDPYATRRLRNSVTAEWIDRLVIENSRIETAEWGMSSLINAHASINFCNPNFIKYLFWEKVFASLDEDGVFCGTFFTLDDAVVKQGAYGFKNADLNIEQFGLKIIFSEQFNFSLTCNLNRSVVKIIARKK